jgi:uncharacterized protein
MRRAYEKLFVFLAGRRRLLFLGLGGLLLLCVVRILPLSMDEDITALLPSGDPVIDDYRMVIYRFRSLDRILFDIGLEDRVAGQPEKLTAVADELYARFLASGSFARIAYSISPEDRLRMMEFFGQNKKMLFSDADAEALEARFAPELIRQRLAGVRRQLLEPQGLFMKDFLRQDPLGLSEVFLGKFAELRPGNSKPQVSDGRIRSQDGQHILMIAEPRFPASDTVRGARLMAFVEKTCHQAIQKAPDSGIRISYLGGHRSTLDNKNMIQSDIFRTLTATVLGIFLLALLTYRRRLLILLTVAPVAFGGVFALGVISLFTSEISAVVVGCGAVLVGIGVDYAIHILYRLDSFDDPDLDPRIISRHLSPLCLPLLMGAGTTAAAFLSLSISNIPGQRQLGFFAAVGIIGAILFALIFLPQIWSLKPTRRRRAIIPLDQLCSWFFAWHRRHQVFCLLVLIVISLTCLAGMTRISFDGDLNKLNGTQPETQCDEKLILSLWGDSLSGVFAVVRHKDSEKALQRNDRLRVLLGQMKTEGLISSYSSVASIIPSLATQEANAQRWGQFWSAQRQRELREKITRIGNQFKFTAGAFAPFWAGLHVKAQPIRLGALKNTVLGNILEQRIVSTEQETLVLSTFRLNANADFSEMSARIAKAVPATVLVNGGSLATHTSKLVRDSMGRLGLVCLAVVVTILFLFMGRIELVLAVLLPLGLSLLWTLGLMGLLGIPVNMMNALFIVFIFGMAVDYAIFLVNDHLRVHRGSSDSSETTGGAIIISGTSTMCGFGALVLANHPALFSIGITAVIGMGTGLLASFLAVPLVMRGLLWRQARNGVPSLKHMLGGAWALVWLGGGLLLCRFIAYPFLAIVYRRDHARKRKLINACMRVLGRSLVNWFPYGQRVFLGINEGTFKKPCVIVCNHQSPFDVVVPLTLPVDLRMFVKRWVWKAPVMGPLVRAAGFLLAEEVEVETLFEQASATLNSGSSIFVFPEGTRSRTGQMRRFKKGAFELAVRNQVDIVPVVFCETRACLPNASYWIGDHTVVVSVLPPVKTAGQDARALARRVRVLMQDQYQRALAFASQGREFRKKIKALYAYQGPLVENFVFLKLLSDPIYSALGKLVPAGGQVLDLGCGYGLAANILAMRSLRTQVHGLDSDADKIVTARQSGIGNPRLTFETGNIIDSQLPPSDVVLLIDVLHYWPSAIQERILAKIFSCLNPGGKLIMREACSTDAPGHAIVSYAEKFATAIGHNKTSHGLVFRKETDHREVLVAAGFANVEVINNLGRGSNQVFVCEKSDV